MLNQSTDRITSALHLGMGSSVSGSSLVSVLLSRLHRWARWNLCKTCFRALNLSLTAISAEATLPHLAEKLAATSFISARFAYFDRPAQICCVNTFSVPLLETSLYSPVIRVSGVYLLFLHHHGCQEVPRMRPEPRNHAVRCRVVCRGVSCSCEFGKTDL
jgi:hypothetical protein